MRIVAFFVIACAPLLAVGSSMITGEIVERDGFARRAALLEQGIPVAPMPADSARGLVLRDMSGRTVPSFVEPEALDENGRTGWLRVSAVVALPAGGRLPVQIGPGSSTAPALTLTRNESGIVVETSAYRLALRNPGRLELSAGGRPLLQGDWSVELIGDARAILWGTFLRTFVADSVELEERAAHRATILLKGRYTKNWRKQPAVEEPGRRFDCELRFFLNALSPNLRFAWRLTNLTGTKTWLERYALRLPMAQNGGRPLIAADFLEDLGRGAGVRPSEDGKHLLSGGLEMPPVGGYFVGPAPEIHRLFHEGMLRTFAGTIITTGSTEDAAAELAPVDLVLPPQYYSDVRALPEEGDKPTFGDWETQVRRSAEWLLKGQWRGTLWWGEWYREWDETRGMGVQEASNGNSSLAPLYHYWRTGDGRFLRCEKRAAQYTYDIQLSKSQMYQGPMFHTRRHLFDELDWVHPRYQRAKGGLVTSHVILNPVGRREIIATIRSYHRKMFDSQGIPHGWDRANDRPTPGRDGVDTSNFMEALVCCWKETGERWFLDEALRMSRWTEDRWKRRHEFPADHWDWNLSQYALRGLVSLYDATGDERVRDLSLDIVRKTLANTSPRIEDMLDDVGGRKIDCVFYHAWITTKVTRYAPDGPRLLKVLYDIVRQDVAGQREDGLFILDHGIESGRETQWTSFYDAKSLVAYLPVLAARVPASKH